MAATSTLEILQRRTAMKIVAALPENPEAALTILALAKQLVEWKPKT
jgi:hypothetical protein